MKKEIKPKVTIYSKNNCEPCTNAEKFFAEQNIDFIEKNIQGKKNRENLLEFRDVKKYDNIPMIEIKKNGHTAVISGFQKQDVMKELGLKPEVDIGQLNKDIELFDVVHPITDDMKTSFEGISRMVMLDRYSFKDTKKETLKEGDLVVLTVKDDPSYPVRGIGFVDRILDATEEVIVWIEDEYRAQLEGPEKESGLVKRTIASIDKPLEIYYEQIAKRNATGLSEVEDSGVRNEWLEKFQEELSTLNLVPAGRVLYGAGSGEEVTYFNCFSGNTILQTKKGPKTFKELAGQTIDVLSYGNKYRPAEIKSFGEQELFEIEFETGETIEATAGHEWLIADDRLGYKYDKKRVTTLDLEGKSVYQEANKGSIRNSSDVLLGIQNGIVYGDGQISNKDKSSHVLLFGDKEKYAKYFDDYTVTEHYNGDYVGVYGLPLELLELPKDDASTDYWYGFIVGLLGTDGHVDKRGSAYIFSSKQDDLSYISNNIYKTGFIPGQIKMTRELSPFDDSIKPVYRLSIKKESVSDIDLINKLHIKNYNECNKKNPKKSTSKVIKIRPTGRIEEVFCGIEPETHTLVVGSGYLTGNCYVMPYPKDSREGLAEHRRETMEIMSRGGGVGTNGSTLRPRDTLARGVNGKSSGSVSWLDDLAQLTHLVQQGGSRRGSRCTMQQMPNSL